jgi:uncharacterized protein
MEKKRGSHSWRLARPIGEIGSTAPAQMIAYLETKGKFLEDVDSNRIEEKILEAFKKGYKRSVGKSEVSSWRNSMGYMHRILIDSEIPNDSGVAIEFGIPQTSKRIDFILTGKNAAAQQTAVIVELKQWTSAKSTKKDAIVRTVLGGGEHETNHPSYQAWTYAALLEDFNETVRDRGMALKPCAYLHNCASGETICSAFYAAHIEKAPAFLRDDASKLRAFIRSNVRHGDSGEMIYQIRDGKISPSKSLADSLASMLRGNREFIMIDDQKIVYETALELAEESSEGSKNVLIVEGGPGTGKSVVAVNLLVELTTRSKVAQYVTKNAAPRSVYESKLSGAMTRTRIGNLFKSSGAYTDSKPNDYDALVVDEAHRLNEKSGMFMNQGENQIKELINAAKFSVFFIDEDQRVTFKDIGEKSEIRHWARACRAKVTELVLESQFRCNGSDGFLAWVDHNLGIRETANPTLDGIDFDVVVCNTPTELRDRIVEKNKERNKARMVAGYCWDWTSKGDSAAYDIIFPEHGFQARWNLSEDGSLWILKPESVTEIGCIHTCQGLELDYIGVIFGPDFVVRNGRVATDATKRSRMDSSVKGFKKLLKENPKAAEDKADAIIKNTYRTLMTRGQKGCFIYAVDRETNEHFTLAANRVPAHYLAEPGKRYPELKQDETRKAAEDEQKSN